MSDKLVGLVSLNVADLSLAVNTCIEKMEQEYAQYLEKTSTIGLRS